MRGRKVVKIRMKPTGMGAKGPYPIVENHFLR